MALTISTNMLLPIPGVGNEDGPQYAVDINNCLTIVDQHNHTPGSGVPIPSTGININADLPFNNFNLTAARTLRLQTQGSTPNGASDLGCLYRTGVDLYFIDGSGNNVRITQSGGVAGSPGSIASLTSPASATYVSASSTFVWQSDTNIAANMDFASALLRNLSANSKALTLSPPAAMGANYSLILPSLPAATYALTLDTSGNITASAANITSEMLSSNLNFPGNAVQENSSNLIVSNTNATNSLCVVRCVIDGSGNVTGGEGVTSVLNSPGSVTLTFTTPFGDSPSCFATVIRALPRFCTISGVTPSTCTIQIWNVASSLTAEGFSFIAIGQRA